MLEKIFDPYAQTASLSQHSDLDTGLGLAITKRYVEMMGGTITAQSEEGLGNAFSVKVILQKATPEETAALKNARPIGSANFRGKIVLLVEDNALNREIACNILKKEGLEVHTAKDGKEGVLLYGNSSNSYYAAVLMDLRMPEMDGYEATREIRAMKRLDATRVPIIAMSADSFQEDIERAKSAGINDHIAKPIDVKKLHDTLMKYLG